MSEPGRPAADSGAVCRPPARPERRRLPALDSAAAAEGRGRAPLLYQKAACAYH